MSQPYFMGDQGAVEPDENVLMFSWRRTARVALLALPVVAILDLLPFLWNDSGRNGWFLVSLFLGMVALVLAATVIRVAWTLLDRILYAVPLVLFAGVAVFSAWLSQLNIWMYAVSPLLLYVAGGGVHIVLAYGPGILIPRLVYAFVGVPRAMLVMGGATLMATGLYLAIPY